MENQNLENDFYRKHPFHKSELMLDLMEDFFDEFTYNIDLLAKIWDRDEDVVEDVEENDERLLELVQNNFMNNFSYNNDYYEPKIFNEEVAIRCGLIPFTLRGINLIMNGISRNNLKFQLNCYERFTLELKETNINEIAK